MAMLIDKGANPNAHPKGRFSALMYSVTNGNVEGVRLLLTHHAEVSYVDGEGLTALSLAREGKYPEIVALIKSKKL